MGKARSFHPDLVILDVIMPDKNGFEVAREIAADKNIQPPPTIIFLTAAVFRDKKLEAQKEGLGHLPLVEKPISVKELIDCIDQNIEKSHSSFFKQPG